MMHINTYKIMVMAMFLSLHFQSNAQEKTPDCQCPENKMADTRVDTIFHLSNGKDIALCGDYALRGKDIKIAVFDDKVEITSPGNLLPSVDFNDMESGQSDIRNKTLAPVFKKLGIIEQWGNGLQLIAEDLKRYPEIDFRWSQPGLGFRAALINTNDVQQRASGQEVDKKQPVADDYGRLSVE